MTKIKNAIRFRGYSLKVKIKRNDWLLVNKHPIIVLYFEFENGRKFYNLEARTPLVKLTYSFLVLLSRVDSGNRTLSQNIQYYILFQISVFLKYENIT